MTVRSGPPDISDYLAQASEQERELQNLFGRSSPLTIFDIGACEGEDSIRYARRFPGSRIFAFEPLAQNQELVLANFGRFGIENAELVGVALSDQIGEAEFHVSSGKPDVLFCGEDWNYGNKSSSLLPPVSEAAMYGWLHFDEVVKVRCETLDSFCESREIRRIDFVHMDVQGAEGQVLAGARGMLKNIVGIWMEVSDQELYKGQALRIEIERLMGRLGFARTLELRRGIEGDQFYVNLRFLRSWLYLIPERLARGVRLMRRIGGRCNRMFRAAFGLPR